MTITSQLQLSVGVKRVDALTLGAAGLSFTDSLAIAFASGVGANQADRVFADTRTLAASATENLDLAGVLTDPFGVVMTFATIKALIIQAAAGNTNDVNVQRPATLGVPLFLAVSDGLPVKPGGAFVWVAPGVGITVTPATGDLLTITNSAGTTGVTYDVIIIGTSA